MEKEENILGYEKIGKLIRKFSIPCIISLLVNSLYNIVDQIFIGWGGGGIIGAFFSWGFVNLFDLTGTYIILAVFAIFGVVMALNVSLADIVVKIIKFFKGFGDGVKSSKALKVTGEEDDDNEGNMDDDEIEENLKQKIVGKIDNKARYAIDRCIEEMYGEKAFGLYKFGYVEDLNNIDEKELYLYYKNLINSCKIDIFVSGNIKENTDTLIENNENIKKLEGRKPNYNIPKIDNNEIKEKENIVTESMEVTQGKLILGLDVNIDNEELKYDTVIYNSILGGTANSKMFQNVREKAHLAYVASSSYLRHKNIIFVNCGIEISNYQKALDLIKQQIEDMKQGDFTEEDIANAKKGILATIKTIDDEQDTQISYYFGQELTNTRVSTEEYIKKIEKIQKEDVINIARKVSINTIYFLKD